MHQTTELLLPCPFCGGKAALGRDILDPHLYLIFVRRGHRSPIILSPY